jgi:hypothetical protein
VWLTAERKNFCVGLATSQIWFVFAKDALDASDAATHCPFHVLNSLSRV